MLWCQLLLSLAYVSTETASKVRKLSKVKWAYKSATTRRDLFKECSTQSWEVLGFPFRCYGRLACWNLPLKSVAKSEGRNDEKYLDTMGRIGVYDGKELKCEHGRQRSRSKECGGSSICEHGRRRSACKECGGASICEHGGRGPNAKSARPPKTLRTRVSRWSEILPLCCCRFH